MGPELSSLNKIRQKAMKVLALFMVHFMVLKVQHLLTLKEFLKLTLMFCLFVCFPGVTTHCGCIFHSPVAGFSLLVFEVS
jgi:hypothetical protein